MLGALRFLYAILLLGVAAFAAFGFVATFEPTENALPWRIGYAAICIGALVAAVWLVARR